MPHLLRILSPWRKWLPYGSLPETGAVVQMGDKRNGFRVSHKGLGGAMGVGNIKFLAFRQALKKTGLFNGKNR